MAGLILYLLQQCHLPLGWGSEAEGTSPLVLYSWSVQTPRWTCAVVTKTLPALLPQFSWAQHKPVSISSFHTAQGEKIASYASGGQYPLRVDLIQRNTGAVCSGDHRAVNCDIQNFLFKVLPKRQFPWWYFSFWQRPVIATPCFPLNLMFVIKALHDLLSYLESFILGAASVGCIHIIHFSCASVESFLGQRPFWYLAQWDLQV